MTRRPDDQTEAGTDAVLDRRLRAAASAFAGEPLPAELLEAEPLDPPHRTGWAFRAAGIAGVAALLGAAVILGLDQLRPVGVEQPSPTTTIPVSTPAPSANLPTREPAPSPSQPPAVSEYPLFVSPNGICADGDAGFSIFLPDGWYANRRFGDSPPCRTLSPVSALPAQSSDGGAVLGVVEGEPTFDGPLSHERIELSNGVVLDRYEIVTPEQGAVAAEHQMTYVTPLSGNDRWLVATANADDPTAVERLARTLERLEIFAPMQTDPAAAERAAALFEDRDHCAIPGRDITVVYPDAWWTNTATDGLAPCTFYAPGFFEIPTDGSPPDGGLISIVVHDADYGTFEPTPWRDSTTVDGRPATRWEVVPQGGTAPPAYQYIVLLGETPERGPNLVASTTARTPEEYELARVVLDELMRQIALVPAPPGASSAQPDIDGSPLSSSDALGDFVLDLRAESTRVRAGQPIFLNPVLRYVGPEDVATISGSGAGMTGIGVTQLDGPINTGGGETSDCAPHSVPRATGLRIGHKSLAFNGDDPLLSFYEGYGNDPLLRLPPGTYEISAHAHFFATPSCPSEDEIFLRTALTVIVEP